MKNDEEVVRAYSMASYPAEEEILMLNVRVALHHGIEQKILGLM